MHPRFSPQWCWLGTLSLILNLYSEFMPPYSIITCVRIDGSDIKNINNIIISVISIFPLCNIRTFIARLVAVALVEQVQMAMIGVR